MRHGIALLALIVAVLFCSCARKESAAPQPAAGPPAEQSSGAPHAVVYLNDGSKVPGTVVASSQTDMVVAGDDGIERKIPLTQVKSVAYGEAPKPEAARQAAREPAPGKKTARQQPAAVPESPKAAPEAAPPPPVAAPPKTYELPAGSEVSIRTNEAIDSGTAKEGQTFDAQVTRDAKDANGEVVIPRGSDARIVIKSASKGGRFHGASDLVLDLQSIVIAGTPYTIESAVISQKGKSGLGANKRTAEFTGGGAALGAIIGAIAGGGKGAAIGAGAGAGAGALTQILTKGGSIKVPPETVLTFRLDQPLKVTSAAP
ncbi:MAG TPA: hypothetical protein VFA33_04620 [Bryobacteraceae bacterium]|nr:hypothetical protein [Bryobacteraceae bacterium]